MSLDLNSTDQVVIMAVLRLHPQAYGVTIQDEIAKEVGHRPSTGSVYAALERLERKGYVKSRPGEPTAQRGGRRKLHFVITASGQAALRRSLQVMDALRRGLALKEARA